MRIPQAYSSCSYDLFLKKTGPISKTEKLPKFLLIFFCVIINKLPTNDDLKKGKITRNSKFFKKTKIGNNVVIGSNSTLLPVTITSGTVIGAGSTVTKNINVKGIYAGSPAKLLRKI